MATKPTKSKLTKKDNAYIWCDRYDYWAAVQSCLVRCPYMNECDSIQYSDDEFMEVEHQKFRKRERMR